MTHDDLCLASSEPTSWEPEMCVCDLIAKVRKDQREQAIRDCIAAVQGTFKSAPTLGQQKAMAALNALLEQPSE